MKYKKKLYFMIEETKPKVVNIFWYDSNYDKISSWNAKSTHFEKIIFIQQWLTKKCDPLGNCMYFNTNLQKKNHLKILSYEKNEKGLKRIHGPFVK